jgi:hypothetical protein
LAVTVILPAAWTYARATRWITVLVVVSFGGCGAGLLVGAPLPSAAGIILTGLAYAALVPANVLLTLTFPAHLRASVFGILGGSLAVLQAVMALCAASLVDTFGLTGLAGLCAVIAAVAVVVVVVVPITAESAASVPELD